MGLLKIRIALDPAAWHGHTSETVWAEELGPDRFRLRSVPFYARGLSFGDVVLTHREGDDLPAVTQLIVRGGHSTYRVFLLHGVVGDSEFEEQWSELAKLGCTYESATQKLVAIDVPPAVDVGRVYAELEKGEAKKLWEFEEGHYAGAA